MEQKSSSLLSSSSSCSSSNSSSSFSSSSVANKECAIYDLIVIGGGIIGACTALAAMKLCRDETSPTSTKRVLLIEQFESGHDRGSSHGDGRIYRVAYEEEDYVQIAQRAGNLWQEIEKETNKQGELLLNTGGLTVAPPTRFHHLNTLMATFDGKGIQYEYLNASEVNQRFPQFELEPEDMAVYSAESGVLRATEVLKHLYTLLSSYGCDIIFGEKVISLHNFDNNTKENLNLCLQKEYTEIKTSQEHHFIGGSVVLSIGGWAGSKDFNLGFEKYLEVTQETVGYFQMKESNERNSSKGKVQNHFDEDDDRNHPNADHNFHPHPDHSYHSMPVFIFYHENGTEKDFGYYGLPQIDIPGVKVAAHHTGPCLVHAQEKDDISYEKACQDSLRLTNSFVKRFFPHLNPEPTTTITCLYTCSPDCDFILDKAPNYPDNIYVAAGFSGHGFKFAPAIGEMMAQWALSGKVDLPIERFHIKNRFKQQEVKADVDLDFHPKFKSQSISESKPKAVCISKK